MKTKVDLVFIVLVYRNSDDLLDFIKSVSRIDCKTKIIVVNSYFDEESEEKIRKIAIKNDCHYLNVENKGYGYGNNRGIEYANSNFEYDYLVVSNPDIVIKEFEYSSLLDKSSCIVGPQIITLNGKNQNPFYVKRKYFPKMESICLTRKNMLGYYSIMVIYKIEKLFLRVKNFILKKKESYVYALHGSFIIFSKEAIRKMGIIFDENIFLFCEEMVLAKRARDLKIPMIYSQNIVVFHKEDGSISFSNKAMNKIEAESNKYVVEKYYSNK